MASQLSAQPGLHTSSPYGCIGARCPPPGAARRQASKAEWAACTHAHGRPAASTRDRTRAVEQTTASPELPTSKRSPAIGSAGAACFLPLWLHRSTLPAPGAANEQARTGQAARRPAIRARSDSRQPSMPPKLHPWARYACKPNIAKFNIFF